MAVESPALYRIMFGLPSSEITAEITADRQEPGIETLATLVDAIQRAVDAGLLRGDAFTLALQTWALGHGVASLALTGVLGPVEQARAVLDAAADALMTGMLRQTRRPGDDQDLGSEMVV
jgi:hypothetical protein